MRGPFLMFALNIKFGYQIAVLIAYFLMVSYCCFVMEKVPFYRKKSFWTMLISILTALSVYFASSCSRKVVYRSSGIHCDTVKLDVRSNLKLF